MATNETVTLSVNAVVYRGLGLAKLDGLVVFVPHVLPGETVTARITSRRKNFATATLLAVLQPSPHRIAQACPLSGLCPGCAYQHIAYEEEIRIKQAQLTNFLEHWCRVQSPLCEPPFPSPAPLAYRNKITLHAGPADNSVPALGYIADDNRSVIDVPACPLAVPAINDSLARLRADHAFMRSLPKTGTVSLRYASGTGAYHWVSRRHGAVEQTDISERFVTEHTVHGDMSVPRFGFFQVNTSVMDSLISHLVGLLEQIRPETFIDAYCGVGIFAHAAARAGVPRVLAFDTDRTAIEAAILNAKSAGLTNVTTISGPSAKIMPKLLKNAAPATTTVLVDPPRGGLDAAALNALARYKPAELLYASCSPDTLTRDLRILQDAGYEVRASRLFDMFPRTAQFESITRLQHGAHTSADIPCKPPHRTP